MKVSVCKAYARRLYISIYRSFEAIALFAREKACFRYTLLIYLKEDISISLVYLTQQIDKIYRDKL